MKLPLKSLMNMNECAQHHPIEISLEYAKPNNLLFAEAIYRPDAKLWLHEDLAHITLKAAQKLYEDRGYKLRLFDGLRTCDAQEKMLTTQRVKDNPHWLEPPALLSSPGGGAHPRAMAIDLTIIDESGQDLDMGTAFDYLAENAHPDHNPAHRDYKNHVKQVLENRKLLTRAMMNTAYDLDMELLPLPQEWWDYRLPANRFNAYDPICEADLPHEMRLIAQ